MSLCARWIPGWEGIAIKAQGDLEWYEGAFYCHASSTFLFSNLFLKTWARLGNLLLIFWSESPSIHHHQKLHFSTILYSVISVPINDNREHRVLESKREKWKNRTCRAKIQNSCYMLESSWQLCTADLLFCKDAKSCQSFHTEISQNWHVSICQK